ncbi:MAG: lysylphosphatidylglycerol synthase transmembrane domain-containing protein [Pyrinomonadaceae bacterium]
MSIAFSLGGVVLFFFFVRKAGLGQVLDGLQSLGAGFLLILLLSGVRLTVRTLCWMRCFEAPHQLRFRDAFRAYLIGDAMGNLMPLGIVVSEPVKAMMVRERVPLVAALSAVAVENIFYSFSVAIFIFTGTATLLLSFAVPDALRVTGIAILTGIVGIIAVSYFVIGRQWKFASALLEIIHRRGLANKLLSAERRSRVANLEDGIYGFYQRNRSRFLPILLFECIFHLAGVAEVYVTLLFISDMPPTILAAIILESVNRIINVVFKFVPLRVGVDEAGTGLLTNVLKFGTATGVTLAIVRKARLIFWTGAGVGLLLHRGLSLRSVVKEAEDSVAQQVY